MRLLLFPFLQEVAMNRFVHSPRRCAMLLLLVLAAGSYLPVQAQWSPDPSLNLQVCDVTGEQALPKIAPTSSGGTYICWFDNRNGNYDVYLQLLDSLGRKQWTQNGLLISSHPQNTWLVDYDMDVDRQDNAVIVFSDIRGGGDFNPVAYKISPQGTLLWGSDGVVLSESTSVFQATPKVRVTSDDEAVVTWFYGSSPAQVAMQRLTSGGTKRWGSEPVLLKGTGNENLEYPSLVASDSGSVILLWCGFTGSFLNPQNYKLYTQKFSPTGQSLWGQAPDTVYNLGRVPGFFTPLVVSDGRNGALYGWHDDRDNTMLSTSFVQHFAVAGTPAFPANGSAVSTLTGRNHFDVSMEFEPSTGETYAAWFETNDLQTLTGMYAQRYSASGSRLWTDSGLPLIPLSTSAQAYITVFARDTAALVWWVDLFSGGINNAVRGLKLNRLGSRPWGDSVRTVSSAPGEKLHMVAQCSPRGVTTLAWEDRRSDGGGIYAQRIQSDGSLGNPPVSVAELSPIPQTTTLRPCYPNPFNGETRIGYSIAAGGKGVPVSLRVYDVLGREVGVVVDDVADPGEHTAPFNASGLASGVYFYSLRAGGVVQTKRMLLLR